MAKVVLKELKVEVKPITTLAYYITLEGKSVDAGSLWEDLRAVREGGVTIPPTPHGNLMLSLGVLKSLGSNRAGISASKGPNFTTFFDALEKGLTEAGWDD